MHSPLTILITGITSGIGRSFIELSAKQLPAARIIALTKHNLDYEAPANVEIHTVDLTNYAAVKKTIAKIQKTHPHIDVLINNAGGGWRGMVEDTSIEEAKQQMEQNLWSAMHLTQLVLPGMRAQKRGHIINLSSVAVQVDYATIGYYSATKAALEKLSGCLALEVAPWNIHVSVVAPGAVRTKFGHNMVNIKNYGKGPYAALYREWADNFETMFEKPQHRDVAGQKLIDLINHPRPYNMLSPRDVVYSYAKRLLPRHFYNKVLLKRYMHL